MCYFLTVFLVVSSVVLFVGIEEDALCVIHHEALAAFSQIHSRGYCSLQCDSTNADSGVQHDGAGALLAWHFRNKRRVQRREHV